MNSIYPASPNSVPDDLTKPTATYKQRAWLAMAGLGLFVVLYFALTAWFGWTAYRLLGGALQGGSNVLWGFIAGLCAAFLAVFMAKAIFFIKHSYQIDDIEITPAEHPKLFQFLYRLADEAGAPRPHRVFLSPRVNAAVFYDLSILNLILPSKKNLEIGLGLMNVLSLGEFKAVLAHEFGHFAQRSMAVGRWVYIAQQIAGQIISRRDILDRFLRGLSRFDLRIAWVGWLLSLIVWSIRSVMETVFRVVVLAQRALSREMEFQADLVAVSLTGSDAIVHALHRLNVADTAWDRAAHFAHSEASEGRLVADVFAVQSQVINRLRAITDDPSFHDVLPLPVAEPHNHRVFKTELAQPPRMWSTHPANVEREENAKRVYIGAPIDARGAWELFDNVDIVKQQMSAHIVREITEKKKTEPTALADSLTKLDEQYNRAYLQRSYRGAYLGRSITRHAKEPADLYDPSLASADITGALAELYPEPLAADLDRLRRLESEKASLQALYEGFLTAPGGIIRHGGKELRRKELPQVIEALSKELTATQNLVHAHDRRCRAAHFAAAEKLGNGWGSYLRGLAHMLHYADHVEANLGDAQGAMHNVYAIVTADGRVSKRELKRLVDACDELYKALREVHDQSTEVSLDRTLTRRMSVESWPQVLEKFELPPPTKENIGDWIGVIDGWTNAAESALSSLRLAALEQLLLAESQVAKFTRERMTPNAAPEPSKAPIQYTVLLPGKERARQKKLGLWDRFQVADGLVPTLARLGVAAAIIAAVVGVGGFVGSSSVMIYNGLARAVNVQIGANKVIVAPLSRESVQIEQADRYDVLATTADGKLIENFSANAERGFTQYIYNVAGASPLVEWTASYGSASTQPDRALGNPKWTTTTADVVFDEPPASVSTKDGSDTRLVLTALGNTSPDTMLESLQTEGERDELIATHARWDASNSKYAMQWLSLAARSDATKNILAERLVLQPLDAVLLRLEQDTASDDQRGSICERHRALAAATANNPDLIYIATRCIDADAERDQAFMEAHRSWPHNGWLALAAGYTLADNAQWNEALPKLEHARKTVPPFASMLALDVARLRRVIAATDSVPLQDLSVDSDTVRFANTVESGQETDSSPLARAYRFLHAGAFQQALQVVAAEPTVQARLLRLIAASDLASPEHVRKALDLPLNEGIDEDSLWSSYALAIRERASLDAYGDLLNQHANRDTESAHQFLHTVQQGQLVDAEFHLRGVSPYTRGQAFSAATVILGANTPKAWREQAKRLLFATERPHFK
ncbi:MAG: M48 family metalloprotease [Candidatus Obscuribacterales bacterium]|nr:M48 family metalloprotease [Steroidobacteraceae bacterium]